MPYQRLDTLNEQEKAAFVQGFCDACDLDTFDIESDLMSNTPWSQPWLNEPISLSYDGTRPTAYDLGKLWFAEVRRSMLLPKP